MFPKVFLQWSRKLEVDKMKGTRNGSIKRIIPALTLALLFLFTAWVPLSTSASQVEGPQGTPVAVYPDGYDPSEDLLVEAGYRPKYASPDSQFIQTPEPMPEDAIMYPIGGVPQALAGSPTRAAEWTLYYDSDNVDVYVDTSSAGGGSLSANEEQLLDRIISDFQNFSWPRVKDYFDPIDKVSFVDFRVHKIDGPSGVGGYYQPGTDEFHLDRDDFSWGGVIAAHEFQHYCHRQYDTYENLWVDEGCADYGAYLVYGITSAISSHIYAYLQWRPLHSVVVDDYTFYQDTTTSYYGSSFLFQMYLIEHYGGKNYSHGLVRSTLRGINGVNRGLAASGTSDRFEEAFSKFMVALRVNDDNTGDGETYSFDEKTYSYGSVRLPLTRSHSGIPISSGFPSPGMEDYSVNSIRFSSPPEAGETYKFALSYADGNPIASIYYETDPPRTVEHIDFGGSRSKVLYLEGWGITYNSFQLITTSSAVSTMHYELDILDLEPPETAISVSPFEPDGEDGWYISTPKITLSSEISATIYYRLNGGEEVKYTDPIYILDGEWNLSFKAVDRHGNIEGIRFFEIKADTLSPTSSMEVEPDLPDDKWYTTAPRITINTAHPHASIEYKFNNDPYSVYSVPINPPEGISNFFWRSFDQAGNIEREGTRGFKIDTMAPLMSYSIYPELPDGIDDWYITTPTATLSSTEADNIYYSIDGGTLLPYLTPFTIPDGSHTIRTIPIDQAGNQGEEIRFDIKVDTNIPTLKGMFEGWTYDLDNSSQWLSFAPMLTVEGSESDMSINYTENDGKTSDYTKPIQFNEGENIIWVHGMDEAGNKAESMRYIIRVDLRSPFIGHTISSDTVNGWYLESGVEVSLDLVNEDDRSSAVTIEYRWMGADIRVYRDPIKVPEGSSTLIYWSTDLAGNGMESRSIDFKKDSILPSIGMELLGVVDGWVIAGNEFTVDLSESSDENGINFYSLMTGSADPEWTPDPVFKLSFAEPGTYNITGTVRDNAGNIHEKVLMITVLPVEEVADVPVDGGNDLQLLIMVALGIIVIFVILIAVVVVVVVKRGQRNTPPSMTAPSAINGPPPPGLRHGPGKGVPIPPSPGVPPPPFPSKRS